MKYTLLSTLLGALATAFSLCQVRDARPLLTKELYSWADNRGGWNFRILGTTSRQKTVEEIFSAKNTIHGVYELKRRISRLQSPSRLVWFDKLIFNGASVKGTERLGWPPKETIEEIKRHAAARRIEVIGPE